MGYVHGRGISWRSAHSSPGSSQRAPRLVRGPGRLAYWVAYWEKPRERPLVVLPERIIFGEEEAQKSLRGGGRSPAMRRLPARLGEEGPCKR